MRQEYVGMRVVGSGRSLCTPMLSVQCIQGDSCEKRGTLQKHASMSRFACALADVGRAPSPGSLRNSPRAFGGDETVREWKHVRRERSLSWLVPSVSAASGSDGEGDSSAPASEQRSKNLKKSKSMSFSANTVARVGEAESDRFESDEKVGERKRSFCREHRIRAVEQCSTMLQRCCAGVRRARSTDRIAAGFDPQGRGCQDREAERGRMCAEGDVRSVGGPAESEQGPSSENNQTQVADDGRGVAVNESMQAIRKPVAEDEASSNVLGAEISSVAAGALGQRSLLSSLADCPLPSRQPSLPPCQPNSPITSEPSLAYSRVMPQPLPGIPSGTDLSSQVISHEHTPASAVDHSVSVTDAEPRVL